MADTSSARGSRKVKVEKTGVNNPFKYAGGYLDASGYYLSGVRYYDPSLGRWTQQDPVAGSLFDLNSGNRYTYVEDDPVNQVNPSGKDAVSCSAGIIGAIGLDFITNVPLVPIIAGAFATGPAEIVAALILAIAVLAFNYGTIITAAYTFCQ